jgi:hypothetical protein
MENLVELYYSHGALAIYARPGQIAAAEVLHDFRNRFRSLTGSTPSLFIDGNGEPSLSGVENNQLDWFVRRETSMRCLDSFGSRLACIHNRALACRFFFQRKFSG